MYRCKGKLYLCYTGLRHNFVTNYSQEMNNCNHFQVIYVCVYIEYLYIYVYIRIIKTNMSFDNFMLQI